MLIFHSRLLHTKIVPGVNNPVVNPPIWSARSCGMGVIPYGWCFWRMGDGRTVNTPATAMRGERCFWDSWFRNHTLTLETICSLMAFILPLLHGDIYVSPPHKIFTRSVDHWLRSWDEISRMIVEITPFRILIFSRWDFSDVALSLLGKYQLGSYF